MAVPVRVAAGSAVQVLPVGQSVGVVINPVVAQLRGPGEDEGLGVVRVGAVASLGDEAVEILVAVIISTPSSTRPRSMLEDRLPGPPRR